MPETAEERLKKDRVLTAPVILNKDPFLIDINERLSGHYAVWNRFIRYMNTLTINVPQLDPDTFDPILDRNNNQVIRPFSIRKTPENRILNRRATGKPITERAIRDFNAVGTNGIISRNDILLIQAYHNITDSNVTVGDDWVGSQTLQLVYPETNVLENFDGIKRCTKDNFLFWNHVTGLYAVTWGNRRFVIDAKVWSDFRTGKIGQPATTNYIPYDPTIHYNALHTTYGSGAEKKGSDDVIKPVRRVIPFLPPDWDTWGASTTVAPGATGAIRDTTENNIIKKVTELQTKVTNELLKKGR